MMDLCSGTSGAGASVAPARTTVVPLPDIVSPSYAGGAGGDASGSIAEVVRADNADPKRVGEYIDAIMRHLCDLEVRARMLRYVGARKRTLILYVWIDLFCKRGSHFDSGY